MGEEKMNKKTIEGCGRKGITARNSKILDESIIGSARTKSTDRLILPIEIRSSTELKKHTAGPGNRYVFADDNNNPNGNIYCIMRTVKNVRTPPQHIEMHHHNCDSLWMFVGDREDLTGLKVEVVLEDKTYVLDSPASIYIPKGVEHTYRFIEGSGSYTNVVLAKGGKYNTSTK